MRARRPLRRLAFVVLAAGLLFAVVADAYARGGGGGNFGGGGGGGFGGGGGGFGGGGGGGDGGGEIVWLLIQLVIRYPAIGIPLTIVFLVFVAVSARKGQTVHQGRVIRRGRTANWADLEARAVTKLQGSDPAFDPAAFKQRAAVAFRKVQDSWCAQELAPVRPFVSDSIHERFTLQLQEERDLGYRDQMEEIRILERSLVEVREEGGIEVLTLRIKASARDYRVSLETGRHVSGSKAVEEFEEYWSFLRRRGARSRLDDKGLIEGYCGNCGAPVAMNQWANCEHCKALLRSGEHDWVLVEITQASEWRPQRAVTIPGVSELRARDPGFSVQHLEDRVSVMFWRHAFADHLGDVAPLRKIASPEMAEAWTAGHRASVRPDGDRSYVGERGVGTVDTLLVKLGEKRDTAVVSVRWSGTYFTQQADGRREREQRGGIVDTLFVLERKSGVQSDPGRTVSSAHCAHCGAPESGGTDDACQYCGEVMNDGKRDWVLVETAARGQARGRAILESLRTPVTTSTATAAAETAAPVPPGTVGVLAWMVQTSLADGHVDDKEAARLERLIDRAGLHSQRLDRMIEQARAGALEAPAPTDPADAREWLKEAAAVALADGQIRADEQRLLDRLAVENGLHPADVRLVVSETRSRLYQEAKAALRRGRGNGRRDRRGDESGNGR